jgi:hypothetical protein
MIKTYGEEGYYEWISPWHGQAQLYSNIPRDGGGNPAMNERLMAMSIE